MSEPMVRMMRQWATSPARQSFILGAAGASPGTPVELVVMRSRKKLTIGIVLVGGALVVAALPAIREAYTELRDQRKLAEGRALAGVYCASCHLEPVPDILPKRSWQAVLA